MSFLAPLVLGGLAAVGIPIVIHLLNKFRVRKTDWGAMRFLNDIVQKNQRRVKMDDLILLILRCLLVAAAVTAFARPVLKGLGSGEGSTPVAAVVLLDHSASMDQSSGAVSRFDEARSEIRSWLDKQDAQSSVALYLAGSRTVPLIGKPGNDFSLFRKSLDGAAVSGYGSDISQALHLAVEVLKPITGQPKEIWIYTDGQANAFLQRDELRLLARENPDIMIRPIIIGEAASDNLGITALRQEGGVPSVGQPVRFVAEIFNSGAAAKQSVKVDFTADNRTPAGSATVPALAPGESRSVAVNVNFNSAGPHFLMAEIPVDSFPADNRRHLAVEVTSRVDVIIAGSESGEAADSEGPFFLSRALVPLSSEQAAHYYLAPQRAKLSELPELLSQRGAERPEAVFLTNPEGLSAAEADALEAYVKSGGNLVVFPGTTKNLGNKDTPETFAKLLPGRLGALVEISPDQPPQNWQSGGFTHEVTRFWNESTNGNLGSVKFTRYCPLTLKSENSPSVVTTFADNQPSVAECSYGRGLVILFNANLSRDSTNLPLHPAFVPLIQRTINFFHSRSLPKLNFEPGEPFRKSIEESLAGKDFTVLTPRNENARTAGQIASDEGGSYLRYAATEEPGPYQLKVADELVAAFAVQIDPEESDLRSIDPAFLKELSDVPRTTATGGDARMVVLKEYWPALIWCVAAFFVAEAAMAHRMSYAR